MELVGAKFGNRVLVRVLCRRHGGRSLAHEVVALFVLQLVVERVVRLLRALLRGDGLLSCALEVPKVLLLGSLSLGREPVAELGLRLEGTVLVQLVGQVTARVLAFPTVCTTSDALVVGHLIEIEIRLLLLLLDLAHAVSMLLVDASVNRLLLLLLHAARHQKFALVSIRRR